MLILAVACEKTNLGPDDYLRLEHCDIATVETSETSALSVETTQMTALATEDQSHASQNELSLSPC